MSEHSKALDVPMVEDLSQLPAADLTAVSPLSVAGIVHDLGNLIQVATSAVNILARGGLPVERSAPILGQAAASLEEAGALVRQTIGSIRNQKAIAQEANVAACLADICDLIGARDGGSLRIDLDIAEGLPAVRCDPIGLRSAVLNLVFNARDAMADAGVILVRAHPMPFGVPGEAVELRVADSGIGMSPATLSRVFDPFFTTKDGGLGGVGLPMVERFVRDCGGEITIESEVGMGTTVQVRLPAAGPTSSKVSEPEVRT